MQEAPIPKNESERLLSLYKLSLLDTPPEHRFDRITKTATMIFNVSISTLTLVDAKREWFKSVCGLDEKEGDRTSSFCGHALLSEEILVIPDTTKDDRFKDNPTVIASPFIRFYAGVPIKSADGERIGVFCVKDTKPRDFSEDEKRILKALGAWAELEINSHNLGLALNTIEQLEHELATFFDNTLDYLCIGNFEGSMIKTNSIFQRELGYTGEEITRKMMVLNFVHPDDRNKVVAAFKKFKSGDQVINYSVRLLKKDGSFFWSDWNAKPVGDKIYAAGRNITDVKKAEEALLLAKIKNEAMLASIGEGVIATDEKGKIILINQSAEKLLGLKSKEMVGKDFFTIEVKDEKGSPVPKDKRPMRLALAGTTTTTTTTTEPRYYYTRKDGTNFPVSITTTPVFLETKIVGAIDVFRDITKEIEIDKAKSEFVSLSSHQLKTPVGSVKWNLETLLDGDYGQLSSEQRKVIADAYQMTGRMNKIINNLLNISRLELGTIKLSSSVVDVSQICDDVLNELQPLIAQGKYQIVKNFDKSLPEVNTDADLVRMVFQNYLSNAVKYTNHGGRIVININAKELEVVVEIMNSGNPIPPDDQPHIFLKFYRGKNANDADGTGIGLYLVKKIAQLLGGHVWFKSSEGSDTLFAFSLPTH